MKQITLSSCLLAICLSGCTSYMRDAREAEARGIHQRQAVETDVLMLKERLKGIEAAQEQLAGDIRGIRELVSKSDTRSADFMDKLNRSVRQLEERDLTIQKETISALSVKIADIMKSQISVGSAGSGTGVEHTVQTGETLSAIAAAYGVTVSAIVKSNRLSDPNTVRVGQKLFIPR